MNTKKAMDYSTAFYKLTKFTTKYFPPKFSANSTQLETRCRENLGMELVIRESAMAYIVEKGFDLKYGARPLKRKLQEEVEDKLAEAFIAGTIKTGDEVIVSTKNKEIVVHVPANE